MRSAKNSFISRTASSGELKKQHHLGHALICGRILAAVVNDPFYAMSGA